MMCAAPFAGIGSPLMRMVGKRGSELSPQMCSSCFTFMAQHRGGAEIEASFLFADIRGSTALGESMSAGGFKSLLDRFYTTATSVVFAHDGGVDKFVGDELVAMFFPLLSGERHAARAVDAGLALLRGTGHASSRGPWVPVGAGVHTGAAWVGAIGDDTHIEFTALGDTVNTTARLAAAADAGSVLVSSEAADSAGLDVALPRLELELKGKRAAMSVVELTVQPTRAQADEDLRR